MDPRDFLATAGRLLAGEPTEADCRTCVSRAYYAVFLTVRDIMCRRVSIALRSAALGGRRPSHVKTIRCLRGASDSEVRCLGKELDNLYSARLDADYEMAKSFSRDRAQEELANARDTVADIDRVGEALLARNAEGYCQALGQPPGSS